MVDELTKQERIKDFLESKPKTFPILGMIILVLAILNITFLVEAVTLNQKIISIVLIDILSIIITTISGILLTFSTREEYTKGKKILFLILAIIGILPIIFRIIYWEGPFDLLIRLAINLTTIISNIYAYKYDLLKDYYIYFPVEKYGECPWKK